VSKIKKTTAQLKKAAKNEDFHHDIHTIARGGRLVGKGLTFAGGVAGSAGQPELAAPLLAAGGGTLAIAAGASEIARSGLLKKKKKKKPKD
jgi:hypothetical protein